MRKINNLPVMDGTEAEQKVAVIIVNWNTGEYLAKCLESLAALPESEMIEEVIVVDNASSDRSIVSAQVTVAKTGNRPRVRFIKNEKNLGFAAANNVGWKRLNERGSRAHVLLLNPDTQALPGMIKTMAETFSRSEKIGIVGPKILNGDGTLQPSVRKFPGRKEIILYMLKLGSRVKDQAIDYNREQAVDQVMGAIFLIKRECADQVGWLDEKYFVWFEEVDYCQRAKTAGWQVWYTPAAPGIHWGGVSFRQVVGWKKNWPWLKSVWRYVRKHLGAKMTVIACLLIPINIALWWPATIKQWWRKNYG